MAKVNVRDLSKNFGKVNALKDISLDVEDGSFVVLVGPSGCGKSTLLRCIAGLEVVETGSIAIGGVDVTNLPPAQRGIAMVFQSYALYPHKNVADNLGFGLKFAGTPKAEIQARVAEAARMLQLEDLMQRKPRELSGGQRQRVAIGRAIVRKPQVFLFDEPLSNLDAALRVNTRVELARLHRQLKATMIYVTHDQSEAMTLADQIVVMNQGRIEQQGKPLDLYYKPSNLFVARFIGSPAMNLLDATIASMGSVTLKNGPTLHVPVPRGSLPGRDVTLGLRPEHLRLDREGELQAALELVERMGETGYAHLRLSNGVPLVVETKGDPPAAPGETIGVRIEGQQVQYFDDHGLRLIL
jgi:ABC-type sugar transport system ATPase subunit